jgi:hypothetical protein
MQKQSEPSSRTIFCIANSLELKCSKYFFFFLKREYLGCTNADVNCMKSKSADEVMLAQALVDKDTKDFLNAPLSMFFPWTPLSMLSIDIF